MPSSVWDGIVSDVPMDDEDQVATSTGVLHITSSSHPELGSHHYWVTDRSTVVEAMTFFRSRGYDDVAFTAFSSRAAWSSAYGRTYPIREILSNARSGGTGELKSDEDGDEEQVPDSSDQAKTATANPVTPGRPGGAPQEGAAGGDASIHGGPGLKSPPQRRRRTPTPPSFRPGRPATTTHHQAPAPAPPATAGAPAPGPDMTFLMQQLIHLQQQSNAQQLANQSLQAQLQRQQHNFAKAMAAQSALKYPLTKFPTWDGKTATVPLFLSLIESYKGGEYFQTVSSWETTTVGDERESQRVYANMFAKLSADVMAPYLNNDQYVGHGFEMLAHLTTRLSRDRPEHRLQDVQTGRPRRHGVLHVQAPRLRHTPPQSHDR